MKKLALLILLPLVACGQAKTPPAQATAPRAALTDLSVPSATPAERRLRNYALQCVTAIEIKLVESVEQNYSFVRPGAACTDTFLGADALPKVSFVKASQLAPNLYDYSSYNLFLVSQEGRTYRASMNLAGQFSFGPVAVDEKTMLERYARNCAIGVYISLDSTLTESRYDLPAPGTCEDAALGGPGYLPYFVSSSQVTASPDGQTLDIQLSGLSGQRLRLVADTELNTTFTPLP